MRVYTGVFFFCEIMDDISLIIRELSNPSSTIDDFTIYRGLMTIVEYYNALARCKRVPTKKMPVYNNRMNHALLKRLIYNILRDIDRIKDIREEKILTGVKFAEDNTLDYGIWTYTIIEDTINYLSVKLNATAFTDNFGESDTIILGYEYMPYERIIDAKGKEYITVSYKGLFPMSESEQVSLLPDTVKSLTIDNWTNINITDMSFMFAYCDSLDYLTLGSNFDTSSVMDMNGMFASCSKLTALTLKGNFNTAEVTNMSNMFFSCNALTSLMLGYNFNTSNVKDMQLMFYNCKALASVSLYEISNSIIKMLPAATWNVNGTDGTVVIVQASSETWNPTTLPNEWGENERWTLTLQ